VADASAMAAIIAITGDLPGVVSELPSATSTCAVAPQRIT
jgi:hypothetical protein